MRQAVTRLDLLTFIHILLPSLISFSVSRGLASAYPQAIPYPEGAWTLYMGILFVYIGDRLLEKERVPPSLHKPLGVLAIVAVAIAGYLTWHAMARIAPLLVILGFFSLIYGSVKMVPFVKTALVVCTWWLGCTLLPYHLRGSPELDWSLLWTLPSIAFALLMASSALLYDFKDEEADARAGVRSLPLMLGARGAQWVCAGFAVCGMAIAAYAQAWAVAFMGLLLALVSPWLSLLRRPLAGPLTADLLFTLPGLYPFL